jgi:hypothetical protein
MKRRDHERRYIYREREAVGFGFEFESGGREHAVCDADVANMTETSTSLWGRGSDGTSVLPQTFFSFYLN